MFTGTVSAATEVPACPDCIKQFGKKARQQDKLHAKVIWTPSAAIVGSANASSNGLPDEERGIDGLIEAGVLVDDAENMAAIESWFDDLYKNSQDINDADLKAAREARKRWSKRSIPELVDIPLDRLKVMKVAVLVWSVRMRSRENRQVEKLRESKLDGADWYADTLTHARAYPYDFDVLTWQANSNRTKLSEFQLQHFISQSKWYKIRTKSKSNHIVFAYDLALIDPRRSYRIGERSKRAITSALLKKKCKLHFYFETLPEEGFLSWEPLHELLGGALNEASRISRGSNTREGRLNNFRM